MGRGVFVGMGVWEGAVVGIEVGVLPAADAHPANSSEINIKPTLEFNGFRGFMVPIQVKCLDPCQHILMLKESAGGMNLTHTTSQ